MVRELRCRKCGDGFKVHPSDKAMGWNGRKCYISCVTPKGHGLTVNGVFSPMGQLVCDSCGEKITGKVAVAVTQWQPKREGTPQCWENEYGTIMPDEAVKMADKLTT